MIEICFEILLSEEKRSAQKDEIKNCNIFCRLPSPLDENKSQEIMHGMELEYTGGFITPWAIETKKIITILMDSGLSACSTGLRFLCRSPRPDWPALASMLFNN